MDLPAIDDSRHTVGLDRESRVLRARWRTASVASGWQFPSDWGLPEVDEVCVAVTNTPGASYWDPAESALGGLARARANAGTGLAETLNDVAALHAVLERCGDGSDTVEVDALPARLVRIVALGWGNMVIDSLAHAQVTDPLTGLATLPYLRTRLAELYRAATAASSPGCGGLPDEHSLVVLHMDFSGVAAWSRLTGMIVAAEALSSGFDAGETRAAIGPSTVAALVPGESRLAARILALRRALVEGVNADRQLADVGEPRIMVHSLPSTFDAACELLNRSTGA